MLRAIVDYNKIKDDGRPKVGNLLSYIGSVDMRAEDTFYDALEMFIDDCGFTLAEIAGVSGEGEDDFPDFIEWLVENNEFYTLMHLSVVELHLKHNAWNEQKHEHIWMLRDKYGDE